MSLQERGQDGQLPVAFSIAALVPQVSMVYGSEYSLSEKKEPIFRDEIGIIAFWLGSRMMDNSDLRVFYQAHRFYSAFNLAAQFDIPDAREIEEDYSLLQPLGKDLAQGLERITHPLVAFIITTQRVAEYSWLDRFPKNLAEYRRNQGRNPTFIYKIITGGDGYGFSKRGVKDLTGRFWESELIAHELGGVYLSWNNDFPSIGSRRLVEFMNRLLGVDLPGRVFPDYSLQEMARIAWNVNREDFNTFSLREGAISKYPIVDGKPQFVF